MANLEKIPSWDDATGSLNVIIETSKGSRNKLRYDAKLGTFALSKVLPAGMVFPFDFGFVPATLAEDGDPLDVLVLLDEPVCAGCQISCRLIGVIEAEETEDGKTTRNDRLLAVAECSHDHRCISSIKDLSSHLLEELEHFFQCYHDLDGKRFKTRGHRGPRAGATWSTRP